MSRRTRGARLVAVTGALVLAAGCGGGATTGADHTSHSAGAATGDPSPGPTGDAAGTTLDGDLASLVTTEVPDGFGPSSRPEPINQTQAFDLDFYLANLSGDAEVDRATLTDAAFVDGYHLHLQADTDLTWIDVWLFRCETAADARKLLEKDRSDWAATAPDAEPWTAPRDGIEGGSTLKTRDNGSQFQLHHANFATANVVVIAGAASNLLGVDLGIFSMHMAVEQYDTLQEALENG